MNGPAKYRGSSRWTGVAASLAAVGLLCACSGMRRPTTASAHPSVKDGQTVRTGRYTAALKKVDRVRIACDNPTIREEVTRMLRRGDGPIVVEETDPSIHVLSVSIRCGRDFAYEPVYTPRPACVGIDPLTEERIRTSMQNGDPMCLGTLTLHKGGKSVWVLSDRDRFQGKKQVIFFVDRMARGFLKEWREARS